MAAAGTELRGNVARAPAFSNLRSGARSPLLPPETPNALRGLAHEAGRLGCCSFPVIPAAFSVSTRCKLQS